MTSDRLKEWLWWVNVCCLTFLIFSCLTLMAFSDQFGSHGDYVCVSRIHGLASGVAMAFAILAVGLSCLRGTSLGQRGLMMVSAFVFYPLCCFVGGFLNHGSWNIMGSVRAGDGFTYVSLESPGFMDSSRAIARRTEHSGLQDTYKVLVQDGFEWVKLVRPVGMHKSGLVATKTGWLVAITFGERAHMAYNLKDGRIFGANNEDAISPFILIDNGQKMNPDDVAWLLRVGFDKDVVSGSVEGEPQRLAFPGAPSRAAIEGELKSSNPEIRALAARKLALSR